MKSSNDFILVIGGSGDIGHSIISKLSESGFNVLCTYNHNIIRNIPYLESKGKVIPMKVDVCKRDEITALHTYIQTNEITIKGLVYNTGIIKDNLFNAMTEKDFVDVLDVNLLGCFRVCKQFIDEVSQNEGCIVVISSIAGLTGKIGQINYCSSKAALISLTRNLASEYACVGVRVNSVAPGLIKTKMIKEIPEAILKKMKKQIPLKRLGEPIDVANAVNFLLSEDSKYITGQVLVVDGGTIMK